SFPVIAQYLIYTSLNLTVPRELIHAPLPYFSNTYLIIFLFISFNILLNTICLHSTGGIVVRIEKHFRCHAVA
ncbi:hypothetical protein, partial [Rickettsia sp. wb]